MAITAELVKALRERTGAPMMDCKKALLSAEGDIELAIDLMRKAGQTKADKKAGRVAAEGLLIAKVSDDAKHAILLEINSETDFVARDSNFLAFAEQVAVAAVEARCADVTALAQLTLGPADESIDSLRQALVNKVGENIHIRRIAYVAAPAGGIVGHYVHGGRIGVLVTLRNADSALAKDVAMHIAASAPQVVSPEQVSPELVAKEREIFLAQTAESGKPAAIVEKMVDGRIKKFLQEISLLEQPYVKDPNLTIAALLKQTGATADAFTRFVLGEGIEKQHTNFADEVMAQVQGS